MPRSAPQSIPAEEPTIAEHVAATAHALLDAMTDAVGAPSDQSERVRHLAECQPCRIGLSKAAAWLAQVPVLTGLMLALVVVGGRVKLDRTPRARLVQR